MKKYRIVLAVLIVRAAIGIWFALRPERVMADLDEFAQCLAEKEITMYGAAWCAHCKNEKAAFGASFRHVSYVECPDEPKACLAKDIKGYPTWIFPDGRKLVGEQGLQKLSKESGCQLPAR